MVSCQGMASTATNRLLRESRSRSLNYGSVTYASDLLQDTKDNGCVGGRTEPPRSDRSGVNSLRIVMDLPVSATGSFLGARSLLLTGVCSILAVLLVTNDLGVVVHRLCAFLVTTFAIACLFYLLTIYLRNTWSNTSIYVVFLSCFAGDIVLGRLLRSSTDQSYHNRLDYLTGPARTTGVLTFLGVASMFSSLETCHSTLVIVVVSFIRFLAITMLTDLPEGVRPFLAYICGIVGVFVAKYTETAFLSVTSPTGEDVTNLASHGKVEMIKRRRSSASVPNSFTNHLVGRRISLPLLMQKSVSATVSIDSALFREADGILVDMMADPSLPRHLLSGLRAVSNMLKPTESHSHGHRSKFSPLVSLSEATLCGSEYTEWPHGDRLSYLPKKLRRSLPPSLIRSRSSTSTWTTTTSATGMPTFESEPVHRGKVNMGREGSSFVRVAKQSVSIANFDFDGSVSPSSSELSENIYRSSEDLGRADHQIEDGKSSSNLLIFHHSSDKHNVLSENIKEVDDTNWNQEPEPAVSQAASSTSESHRKTSIPLHISFFEDEKVAIFPADSDEDEYKESSQLSEETLLAYVSDEVQKSELLDVRFLCQWDYSIFDLAAAAEDTILSRIVYKTFTELGFLDTFHIPVSRLLNYFHALELGYHDKPYHNRIHAADVLHAVFYVTTQPIPGFTQVNVEDDSIQRNTTASSRQDRDFISHNCSSISRGAQFDSSSYGIMAANFPPLELMALYTAAAMHDYDHPGRTNAFLVSTSNALAVLYNDRSVLECHHAASAWSLLLSKQQNAWLENLDKSEFKRFRFLVIEAILATDLKQHFELLSEFNAKVNDDDAVGIDWSCETDRLMVANMVIKMADINGPCKRHDLHKSWTQRICEEFYEQGDEEAELGLPISPYMDRKNPQVAKLQESFINHLVSPLCSSLANAGLLPGSLDDSISVDKDDVVEKLSKNHSGEEELEEEAEPMVLAKQVVCCLVKNLESNIETWAKVIEQENALNEKSFSDSSNITPDTREELNLESKPEMEPITEEDSTNASVATPL